MAGENADSVVGPTEAQTHRYLTVVGREVQVRESTDRLLAAFSDYDEAVRFMQDNGWVRR